MNKCCEKCRCPAPEKYCCQFHQSNPQCHNEDNDICPCHTPKNLDNWEELHIRIYPDGKQEVTGTKEAVEAFGKIEQDSINEALLAQKAQFREKIKHIAMYHDGPGAPFYKVQDILDLLTDL